jgi:hypothetical protein
MSEVSQTYKKKQAILVLLVFVCIVAAFLAPNALATTGAIMLGIVFALLGAKLQPDVPPDAHHH